MAGCRTWSGADRWSYVSRARSGFSFQFVLCYAKPYSNAWRTHNWILSDYYTLGDNPSKVSSLQTFHQLSYGYYSMLSHLFLVLSHRVCDNELLSVSLSFYPSVQLYTLSPMTQFYWLTEQIVNRFHSNLFACLSIISPCTGSYCICIYLFVKQICSRIMGFFFL